MLHQQVVRGRLFAVVMLLVTAWTLNVHHPSQAQASDKCECITYVKRVFSDWPDGIWPLESGVSLKVMDRLREKGVSVTQLFPTVVNPQILVGNPVVFAPGVYGADPTFGHIGIVRSAKVVNGELVITVRHANYDSGSALFTEANCWNVRDTTITLSDLSGVQFFTTKPLGSTFLPNEVWINKAFLGSHGNFFADVTGDGKADALVATDDAVVVRRSNGSTFLPNEVWINKAFLGSHGNFFADVTGDGKADALVATDDAVVVRRSNGSTFLPNEVWINKAFLGSHGNYFADVDGDGRADALVSTNDGVVVRRSNGSSFLPNEVWIDKEFFGLYGTFFVDVTGDGRADAVSVGPGGVVVRRSNGIQFLPNEVWIDKEFLGLYGNFFADVSGDGRFDAGVLSDVVVVRRVNP